MHLFEDLVMQALRLLQTRSRVAQLLPQLGHRAVLQVAVCGYSRGCYCCCRVVALVWLWFVAWVWLSFVVWVWVLLLLLLLMMLL